MINQHFLSMLNNKSVIRELSEYATARGKEIGYENVFDFSLGNPSVPAPQSFTDAAVRLLETEDPVRLHGYSPSLGLPDVKKTVAESLSRRFGVPYTAGLIFPTSGCAGAIAHAVRAVSKAGDEIMIFAPFFPEYIPYINDTGAKARIIPAHVPDFQINLDALEQYLEQVKIEGQEAMDRVAAVLINSPNNPSGIVYTEETLRKLAQILTRKSEEFGHTIFLISDEPYREIVFDGKTVPYPAKYYAHTLTCYSFSKSLSVPGERIGYVAVNPACECAEYLVPMMGQISRGIGHNCPSSLIQLAMAESVDDTADLNVYETNMNLLYDTFKDLGFEVQRPGGTFYIMPKALEDDAAAFCKKALQYDLVFVPCEGFHAPGYFRVAYCQDTEKVRRALPVIRKFAAEVYGR
ncbi:MAG: pyridoxal phosphate-dependent aminotransferase [Lachnospiraceae bacterium]|nr:pyridoxal phosphate-dependent aminotransferase [Lachnospiraceae bacterium]